MRDNGASCQGATRVHAVILTRDRPEALGRCVDTALSTLSANDALTVLDDSCETMSRANAAVLTEAARRSMAYLTHLRSQQVHDAVARATGGPRALWQAKTAPRDIAPLRNLSLLISAAVDAQTTLLVDDDICGFDLEATHRMVNEFEGDREPGGVVVGAKISGTNELDTITKLLDAMRALETNNHNTPLLAEELFRMPPGHDDHNTGGCRWVSGGYMAFRLPPVRLFAFPPGYNEDWLWCLLHGACEDTRVLRAGQSVVHDPPSLRRPTRDDLIFELAGCLVFDGLSARRYSRPVRPDAVLEDLAQHAPVPSDMPLVRAEEVVQQARKLSENGRGPALPELEIHGLSALRGMLQSGELEMDGSMMLSAWSGDAVAKHRSFAATLGTGTALVALEAVWQGGRL